MIKVYDVSLGEESYGLVYRNDQGLFELWEMSQYGGEQQYYATYDSLDDAVEAARSELT